MKSYSVVPANSSISLIHLSLAAVMETTGQIKEGRKELKIGKINFET